MIKKRIGVTVIKVGLVPILNDPMVLPPPDIWWLLLLLMRLLELVRCMPFRDDVLTLTLRACSATSAKLMKNWKFFYSEITNVLDYFSGRIFSPLLFVSLSDTNNSFHPQKGGRFITGQGCYRCALVRTDDDSTY